MAVSELCCTELDKILHKRALQPVFQPILNLQDGTVIAYEALIRGPSDSPLHSPLLLFKTALGCGQLEQLEMLCRELSIASFAKAELNSKLFLNVNPLILLTADHPSGLTKQLLKAAQIDPSEVVIEISEQYQVEDAGLLVKAVQHYRELGFQIAIDDLGSGFSGLKLWSELQPDIVKIDRHFISELDKDLTKQAFVRNIVSLAKAIGATVVAEGIETAEELRWCRELGADLGQGYLLGRPQASFADPQRCRTLFSTELHNEISSEQVEALLLEVAAVSPQQTVAQAAALFQSDSQLQSLPVVEQGRPVGLICRADLQALLAQPFGRALYEKKSLASVMNRLPVVVEISATLEEVSQRVADDEHNAASWFFIICRQGEYCGLGSVRALLKQISERKLQLARYANPLTLLPGNVPIYQRIDKLLRRKANFAVAYLDLNHFKPYNDSYGYSKGDAVLLLVAELLQQHSSSQSFVGHIGGDDFVLIAEPNECEMLCRQVVQLFAKRIALYYRQEDLRLGGITALSRNGDSRFYPLLSLAVGIAHPDPAQCFSHHDVAALSAAAKQEAKRLGGNTVFISRRRGPERQHINVLAGPSVA